MMVGRLEGRYLEMLDLRPRCPLGARDRDLRRLLGAVDGARVWPPVGGSPPARSRRSMPSSPAATSPPAPTPTDRGAGRAGDRDHRHPGRPLRPGLHRRRQGRPTPTTSRRSCPSWHRDGLIAADNTLWSGRDPRPLRHQRGHRRPPPLQRRLGRRPPCGGGPDHRPRRGDPHPASRLGRQSPTDAGLPPPSLAPCPERCRGHRRAGGGVLRAGRAGRRHRDRGDRAPLPLHPGQRTCSAGSGTTCPAPALRPGMAAYWDHHARVRSRRLRGGGRGGEGRGPAGGRSVSRSTTTAGGWTRWPAFSPATRSTCCSAPSTGSGAWRFDVLDEPLTSWPSGTSGTSTRCGTSTPGPWRSSGASRGVRRLRPPRPGEDRRPGARRCPTSSTTGSPRPRCDSGMAAELSSAGWQEAGRGGVPGTPPAQAIRRPRRPAHHRVRRPRPARRGRSGRRPARLLRRAGVSRLQGYRDRRPYEVLVTPARRCLTVATPAELAFERTSLDDVQSGHLQRLLGYVGDPGRSVLLGPRAAGPDGTRADGEHRTTGPSWSSSARCARPTAPRGPARPGGPDSRPPPSGPSSCDRRVGRAAPGRGAARTRRRAGAAALHPGAL